MNQIQIDLHTHNYRCKHASGTVAEYADQANSLGLSILGISDHVPFFEGLWPNVRMHIDDINSYLHEIDQEKKKYPNMTVLSSFECEYIPGLDSYYQDFLLGEKQCDYLVLGTHYIKQHGDWQSVYGGVTNGKELSEYTDLLIQGMTSGYFLFAAHPDLFGNSYPHWDKNCEHAARDILQAAQDLDMPLEINGYGLRKGKRDCRDGRRYMYPWEPFWEIAADYDIRVLANSDAHRAKDVGKNIDQGVSLAKKYNLKIWDYRPVLNLQAQ